jgi:hypothetical protein
VGIDNSKSLLYKFIALKINVSIILNKSLAKDFYAMFLMFIEFTTVPLTFSFAQLAKGKSLGRSKPATNSQIQALATHCVDYFYYMQALLNCLL